MCIRDSSDTVEVPLVNTEGNPCYMKFAVKLKDSGEVLYESELVPPGKAVPEIRLNRPLEAGTYPVAVEISTFSLDDPTQPLNGAQMLSLIHIFSTWLLPRWASNV